MVCYHVWFEYTKNKIKYQHDTSVDARDLKSAKRKIARKHNIKRIKVLDYCINGYY